MNRAAPPRAAIVCCWMAALLWAAAAPAMQEESGKARLPADTVVAVVSMQPAQSASDPSAKAPSAKGQSPSDQSASDQSTSAPPAGGQGEPVLAGEVYLVMSEALRGRDLAGDDRLTAHTLDQVINRRLVADHLAASGSGAGDEEIDLLLSELGERLKARDSSLDEFLQQRGASEAALRRRFAWQVAWHRFIDSQLSDEALQRHFESNQRQFDGTLLRVSHILLKSRDTTAAAARAARSEPGPRPAELRKRAEQLRADILAGRITFAEAARRHSAGPSRRQGGDLGFIPRHRRMVESFARAAFELEKGQISPPVTTQFGVHLIECTDVKPGGLTWTDVRDELARSLARHLFDEIARAQRGKARVRYTGAMAYIDPATGKLVAASY